MKLSLRGRGSALRRSASCETVSAHLLSSAPFMAVRTSPSRGAVKTGLTLSTTGTPVAKSKVRPSVLPAVKLVCEIGESDVHQKNYLDMKRTLKPRLASTSSSPAATSTELRCKRRIMGRLFLSLTAAETKPSTSFEMTSSWRLNNDLPFTLTTLRKEQLSRCFFF